MLPRKVRSRAFESAVFDATFALFGTEHSVRPSVLLSELRRYDLDILCYELGRADSLANSSANEHRAIKEYASRRSVELRPADVGEIDAVLNESAGFDEERVRTALGIGTIGPSSLSGDDAYDEAKERLGKIEAQYPDVYEFFIALRDMRMCSVLRDSLDDAGTVGLVVGMNHYPGIVERMETVR